jgi:hypothetical protein
MAVNTVAHVVTMLRRGPDARLVQAGTASTYGVLDAADAFEATDGAGVDVVGDVVLTVATGTIAPAKDSLVTVDGIKYRVLTQPMRIENGDMVRYRLSEAGTAP